MASANLDFVRSLYAAWGRGDWSSVEWAHPEIELVAADGPTPGRLGKGRAELAEGWRDFLGAWEDYRTEGEEYRELDGERVLVLVKISGRGKTSGLPARASAANLVHLRDGKVTRLVLYWDRERALAELGLRPEASSTYES